MRFFNTIVTALLLLIFYLAFILGRSTNAAEITLPKLSPEIRALANQAAANKSNARVLGLQLTKPTISTQTINNIKKYAISVNKEPHSKQVKQLLNQTINNSQWQQTKNKLINNLYKKTNTNTDNNQTRSGHRIYLFVSSSIPTDKLRQYTRQLASLPNAQIILRGFIGGGKKMAPTMRFIKDLLVKDKTCHGITCKTYNTSVNIDPVLFNRYNISRVPSLIYVDILTGANWCSEGNAKLTTAKGVHQFTGLAPLKYMLRELAQASKNPNLTKLYEERYVY